MKTVIPTDTIEKACVNFIQAVSHAKEVSASPDDFWANRRAEKAYRRMFTAITKSANAEVKWQLSIWELAGSTAEQIWEDDVDEASITKKFVQRVLECLDDLAAAEWIACVPVEHVFSSFPEFSDFGDFFLVNPKTKLAQSTDELLERFRSILASRLGVTFLASSEITTSYIGLCEHYYNKSGKYIPGRPQLVVRVGRGETATNQRLLKDILVTHSAMLSLSQIAYELDGGWSTKIVSAEHAKLPDGRRMQRGSVENSTAASLYNS